MTPPPDRDCAQWTFIGRIAGQPVRPKAQAINDAVSSWDQV
jgi:hypothetical protein